MADRYLLESSATDGYLLEDGSGVLVVEGVSEETGVGTETAVASDTALVGVAGAAGDTVVVVDGGGGQGDTAATDSLGISEVGLIHGDSSHNDSVGVADGAAGDLIGMTGELFAVAETFVLDFLFPGSSEIVAVTEVAVAQLSGQVDDVVGVESITLTEHGLGGVDGVSQDVVQASDAAGYVGLLPPAVTRIDVMVGRTST